MVAGSWDGLRTRQVAEELDCHPADRARIICAPSIDRGLDGLGMKPGVGPQAALTEQERSAILALVKRSRHRASRPTNWTGELAAPEPDGLAGVDARYIDRRRTRARHPGGAQPGTARLSPRGGALAAHARSGPRARIPTSPQRARIVTLYTAPPEGATVLCVAELGP